MPSFSCSQCGRRLASSRLRVGICKICEDPKQFTKNHLDKKRKTVELVAPVIVEKAPLVVQRCWYCNKEIIHSGKTDRTYCNRACLLANGGSDIKGKILHQRTSGIKAAPIKRYRRTLRKECVRCGEALYTGTAYCAKCVHIVLEEAFKRHDTNYENHKKNKQLSPNPHYPFPTDYRL